MIVLCVEGKEVCVEAQRKHAWKKGHAWKGMVEGWEKGSNRAKVVTESQPTLARNSGHPPAVFRALDECSRISSCFFQG